MRIQLTDVSYAYDKGMRRQTDKLPTLSALHQINLSLAASEMIAIAGRSGSGKTTLLHLLKGFLKPSAGTVRVEGRDPWLERKPEVFDPLGLVFQYPEHQLFASTVFEDVAFGPKSRYGTSDTSNITAAVTEAMVRVGLDIGTYADRSPFELSGGEKRRAAIAGVLALRPKLLLLDEPTAGLDLHAREALFGLLHELREKTGMTVLWVTHQLPEALAHATRLLWLDGGRLVRDGIPMDILSEASFLSGMGMNLPESLSLRQGLLSAGFGGISCPWDAKQLAEELVRQRRDRPGKGD